ncbi:MAG: hypothetical protein UV54_C0057G0002 [Candidatus Beckwithbacteria bacterium GW2011_GWA2_43_10]|uniref:Dockerin domain-containing protein n=1 Tax=Candidatus Beckwithbacteria bacterium GW2011_GWA2_43_10 TaxID=1618369 RepID=A0A0G1BZ49_9BACT|nr:MAG: hypothetical protein UV54_C0057G0002 [Candidatus Beckwithbacteria bacterium GW2011_GWA2_43_10]
MRNNLAVSIVGFVMLAFVALPNLSSAATVDELQVQISALRAQIKSLQEQLAVAQQGTTQQWCHDFNVNLKIGDFDAVELEDIYALHEALVKEGFSFPSKVTLGGQRSFDEETASAVVGFQQKYKDEILTPLGLKYGTGFMGPSTRAKLNKLYGCGVPVKPTSITVLSPNGGGTWEMNKKYTITWKHNLAGNFEAWIDLLKGGTYYGSIVGGESVRLSNAQNLTSYSWQVGNMKGGVGEGSDYQVRITYRDLNNTAVILTDTSDNYFSIVSTVQPSITVLSPNGGEKWEAGKTHTITWNQNKIDKVTIYLMRMSSLTEDTIAYNSPVSPDSQTGSYAYVVPQNINLADTYKIWIIGYQTGVGQANDWSDASFSISLAPISLALGDVNKNGRVDIGDSLFIAQYVIGQRSLDSSQLIAADVNKDGKVSTNDAKIIAQYDVGKYTSLPVNVKVGDVNKNGRVDIGDSLFIAQYLAGQRTFDAIQEAAADVNNDNQITQADADTIASYLVDKIKELPTPYVVPATTSQNDNTSLTQMASALQSIQDIINKIAESLKR